MESRGDLYLAACRGRRKALGRPSFIKKYNTAEGGFLGVVDRWTGGLCIAAARRSSPASLAGSCCVPMHNVQHWVQDVADSASSMLKPKPPAMGSPAALLALLEVGGSSAALTASCVELGIEADIPAEASAWQRRWALGKPSFERRWVLGGTFLGMEQIQCTETNQRCDECNEHYRRQNEPASPAFHWAMQRCAPPGEFVWSKAQRSAETAG